MKRRIFMIVVAAVLVFGMLLGCTATTNTPKSTAAPTTGQSSLPSSQPTQGVLKVGIDDTYPPMEFTDESGNTVGFDIDMANEIGKRLNMKVEFIPTVWEGIFAALDSDKFDCIISSLSITDERKKTILFSQPYIANAQVIVVPTSNETIKVPADLAGKKVGVQSGTTAQASGEKFNATTPFESFDTYPSVVSPFEDMKIGRLDAIIVDGVVALDYVNKYPNDYKFSGIKLDPEPIGIGFKLSNTALKDKIDPLITAMKKDGTLVAFSQKWFKDDFITSVK